MNNLADYSPGEILAAYTVAIIIASAAGAVAGVIADRIRVARTIRRTQPLMRIPLPAPATAPDRHRSVATVTRDADGQVIGVKYPATGTEARA